MSQRTTHTRQTSEVSPSSGWPMRKCGATLFYSKRNCARWFFERWCERWNA